MRASHRCRIFCLATVISASVIATMELCRFWIIVSSEEKAAQAHLLSESANKFASLATVRQEASYPNGLDPQQNTVSQQRLVVKNRIWYGNPGESYLFDAIGYNTTAWSYWNSFYIIGQYVSQYGQMNISCCFLSNDFKKYVHPLPRYQGKVSQIPLNRRRVVCPNPFESMGQFPRGITLAFGERQCTGDHDAYMPPYLVFRRSGQSLAICSKIAFGTLDSEQVIEWIETNRYLGVDRVVTFIDKSLNNNTKRVLQYYSSIGFLELIPYELPGLDINQRELHFKRADIWNDKETMVVDCTERLRGYKYVGVVDFDEFIVPTRNRSLKQLMEDLFSEYPLASGFQFKTVYYMKEWVQTNRESDMMLAQFLYRTTDAKIDRAKNIVMPERTRDGGILTHSYVGVQNFKKESVPVEDAVIRHYRHCREGHMTKPKGLCYRNDTRRYDDTMLQFSKLIQDNVEEVRKIVF